MTDGQSPSPGVRLPSGAHDQIFVSYLEVAGYLLWIVLSDESMGL
jgi:hypothetical protein